MCYEQRSFRLWEARKARKREEAKPEFERTAPSAEPPRPSPQAKPAEKVERELEPV